MINMAMASSCPFPLCICVLLLPLHIARDCMSQLHVRMCMSLMIGPTSHCAMCDCVVVLLCACKCRCVCVRPCAPHRVCVCALSVYVYLCMDVLCVLLVLLCGYASVHVCVVGCTHVCITYAHVHVPCVFLHTCGRVCVPVCMCVC